jgi:hypothetical protein
MISDSDFQTQNRPYLAKKSVFLFLFLLFFFFFSKPEQNLTLSFTRQHVRF